MIGTITHYTSYGDKAYKDFVYTIFNNYYLFEVSMQHKILKQTDNLFIPISKLEGVYSIEMDFAEEIKSLKKLSEVYDFLDRKNNLQKIKISTALAKNNYKYLIAYDRVCTEKNIAASQLADQNIFGKALYMPINLFSKLI